MEILKIILISGYIIYSIGYLIFLARTGHMRRTFLIFGSLGIAAMIIINLTKVFTGIEIPVNLFSLLICATLGVPGVTALLMLNFLF